MEFKNVIGYFVKDAIIYMTHRQVMRAGVCVVERDVVNDILCIVVSHASMFLGEDIRQSVKTGSRNYRKYKTR